MSGNAMLKCYLWYVRIKNATLDASLAIAKERYKRSKTRCRHLKGRQRPGVLDVDIPKEDRDLEFQALRDAVHSRCCWWLVTLKRISRSGVPPSQEAARSCSYTWF
eukprot:2215519-Amphidinium_carterae.2